MKIKITKKDINEGTMLTMTDCPIAKAIKRNLVAKGSKIKKVEVSNTEIRIGNKVYEVPDSANYCNGLDVPAKYKTSSFPGYNITIFEFLNESAQTSLAKKP